MNEYFTGAINQMIERGQHLIGKIPSDLPRDFHVLSDKCQSELERVLDVFRMLLEDPRMLQPALQSVRLRSFRRAVADMDFIETLGLSALERANETDCKLNSLMEAIRREIAYPILPPVVTSLSQEYFHISPQLNLLFVPPCEGDFLLHLPDLYHELAHPLVSQRYNPKVKPFQEALGKALGQILNYLQDELTKEQRRRSPDQFEFYLQTWQQSWIEAWTEEFFCDLFGIYTLGPAYAWAHLHLCAKRGGDPYAVPLHIATSHPADDARMQVMLLGLRRIGFSDKANSIHDKWNDLLNICGSKVEAEYYRCYPQAILEVLSEEAFNGISSMRCNVISPTTHGRISGILNEAWNVFWNDPNAYAQWEKSAVEQL